MTDASDTCSNDKTTTKALVGIIMGSTSDFPTMRKAPSPARSRRALKCRWCGAHAQIYFFLCRKCRRTGPQSYHRWCRRCRHLPGMCAAKTSSQCWVPLQPRPLRPRQPLSIVQMPGGIPVGTLAIGESGQNAGLLRRKCWP